MVCHDPPLTHCIFVGSSSFDEDEQVPFPWLFSLFRTETLRDPHTALLPLEIAFHGIPFDLLSNSNPPARLRIRRAKGFKGSAFHPTALKLASDQPLLLKNPSMAADHSQEKRLIFPVTCP